MFTRKHLLGAAGATVLLAATITAAGAGGVVPNLREGYVRGNVVFIHPDGTGPNHWGAARMFWYGPDALSPWDRLPEIALYRGHMEDFITGTSNGGATTHAFGYKVDGPGSFGQDGLEAAARKINALSGYPGSILREAANSGHPVGLVNDGDIAEPGTGAFVAEIGNRSFDTDIITQFIDGRPGFEGEVPPPVILGGGEAFFLPTDTPRCTIEVTLDCTVHVDPITGQTAERTDGRNLLREFQALGYEVVRTRDEFNTLRDRVAADPKFAPKVLGLFAAEDIFNDVPEERLIATGMVNPDIPADAKETNLILFGDKPGTLGFNPPTAAEMGELAMTVLQRHADKANKPFLLVAEVESTDNFGNNNNAIGTLTGLKHANELIAAAQTFQQERVRRTLILTAADSDAGGMQLIGPVRLAEGNVGTLNYNPTGDSEQNVAVPLDGRYGRATPPFFTEPDAAGVSRQFAVAWISTPDVAGGIVSRAQGRNAREIYRVFSGRFDNTDVYRMMYLTLFGRGLPPSVGETAPSR